MIDYRGTLKYLLIFQISVLYFQMAGVDLKVYPFCPEEIPFLILLCNFFVSYIFNLCCQIMQPIFCQKKQDFFSHRSGTLMVKYIHPLSHLSQLNRLQFIASKNVFIILFHQCFSPSMLFKHSESSYQHKLLCIFLVQTVHARNAI